MNKSVDVSIIYVNYNTQALIEDSLNSVIKNLHGFSYEVIVVDNASNSFDKTALKKIYPQVKILIQDKNLGFGGGNNAGAAIANGKYLWLLNTDTLIPKDNELHLIHDFLENHTGYAAASLRAGPAADSLLACFENPAARAALAAIGFTQRHGGT